MDLYLTITHAELVLEQIKSIRKNVDQEFRSLYNEATKITGKFGSTIPMPPTVGRQLHRNNTTAETPKVHYK